MKFKKYVVYSLKGSNIEYIMGVRRNKDQFTYYFLYYRVIGKKGWTLYPSKRPETLNFSCVENKNNKRWSSIKEITKEKLFAEVL